MARDSQLALVAEVPGEKFHAPTSNRKQSGISRTLRNLRGNLIRINAFDTARIDSGRHVIVR